MNSGSQNLTRLSTGKIADNSIFHYSIQKMSPTNKFLLGKLPAHGDNRLNNPLSTSTFSTTTNPATPARYKSLALPLRSYFSAELG
mmetsp:Transcript_503/g.712  ORF Transcript_503/g.712 Transcript_503/m.712 type:complete len:86 (-) Transcript_503:233-490(-)